MDQYRVKTSFEKVIAHRTRPPFAYAAEEDGVIELIDTEAKVLRVKYKSGKIVAVNFGDEYTNNGGGGFYCTQNIVINNFKQKDKVKRGDIIVYNEKFFTPDPYSKQVEWNLGVEANVACIDNNNTLDDGNAISAKLANKLRFNPVHIRDVVIKKNTTIHRYAAVGTNVLNTDPLMIFDQSEMDDSMFGKLDDNAIDLLSKLNRQTPKAKFTGKIVKIDVFYKCEPSEMAPGLRGIVNLIKKEKTAKASAASEQASNIEDYRTDTQIKYTDRIGTTDLDDETVIIRFYIQQDMEMDMGSKIEFSGPFKSVNAYQVNEGWMSEDGSIEVDALFSSLGISNRIANSPLVTGIAARVMDKVEKDILELYFKK